MYTGLTNLYEESIVDLTIGDRSYAFKKWTFQEYVDRESHIVRRRSGLDTVTSNLLELIKAVPDKGKLIDAICKGLESGVHTLVTQPSYATAEELAAFHGSDEGVAMDLFLSLRGVEENGIKTLTDAKMLLNSLVAVDETALAVAIKIMSVFCKDMVNLGNSQCPFLTRAEAAEKAPHAEGGDQHGEESSNSQETHSSSSE